MITGKLTITEAAERLNVTRQRMHQIIVESNLRVEVVHARLFLIHPRELEKIRAKSKPGRKPKKELQSP
jgi:predicted DNA-binding protein YlxM (UPF0122 family)